jgi:hypothetical protein
MPLSPADRIRLGIDEPPAEGEIEFLPAPSAPVQPAPPTRAPNLKLVLKEGEKASSPRIRQMVNELLAGNIENADYALKQLFAANPKLGLEMYIELAQFSLPKLKAVAVQVDDRSENPRNLSFAQLQQALQGE